MLTFFGIVLILLGLTSIIIKPFVTSIKNLEWLTTQKSTIAIIIGVLMSITSGIFFYAEPGTAYAVQYP